MLIIESKLLAIRSKRFLLRLLVIKNRVRQSNFVKIATNWEGISIKIATSREQSNFVNILDLKCKFDRTELHEF